MDNEQEFVNLLHKEMEELKRWCQGKEVPKTATGCEEFVRPFVYRIEKLMYENKAKDQKIADLEAKLDEKTRIAEGYCELFDKKQHENYEQFCEIQELKKQLAESEENKLLAENCIKNLTNRIKKIEEDYGYINKISHELGLQNFDYEKQVTLLKSSEKCLAENVKQLKQQLAEKEKSIKDLVKRQSETFIEMKEWKNEAVRLQQSQNQTAIAELEKVKILVQNAINFETPDLVGVYDAIDNQIKSLKGEK